MFDPSKLNLDLKDEQDINKKEEIIEEIKTTNDVNIANNVDENSEKGKIIKNTINENDILTDLSGNNDLNDSKINEKNQEIINIPKNDLELELEKDTQKKEIKKEKKAVIYDINIISLENILNLLLDKEYDFAVFEPFEELVKITFKKDKLDKEIKNIKYPIYSQILIKTKKITKLEIDESGKTQEGSGEVNIKNKIFSLISKTVPNNYSEKLFIKLKETEKKVKKEVKKTSLNQIFGFLGAIAFISLVIGGAFTGFVVLNAKTVEDVKFFYSLGINLNDINTFISKIITIIFSILMFIETIFLIVYLFKFSLTKKEFKQKKIRYGVFATIFLIITLSTGMAWMVIDKKVNLLPNWQIEAYGDIQLYDNSKLISEQFDIGKALITDTNNIIGPIEIKFDLSVFTKKEEQNGFKIKNFIWDFGVENEDIIETPNPIYIKEFREKGNYTISLIVEEIDLKGDIIEKKVDNIPNINIGYIVEQTEKKLDSGGKLVDFDASSLKELGKIEWYFFDDLSKPVWKGDIFKVGKPIFKETLIGMYIRRNGKEDDKLDKVFIISAENKANLDGEIIFTRSLENDLEVELKVNNTEVDFGNGYIEEYKWIIENKEITKVGGIENPSEASKTKYTFNNYGKHTIKLFLKDSVGNIKELSTTIDIPKILKLNNILKIYNNGTIIQNVKYEPKLNEYYLGEIGTPTQIKFDARRIKADNLLYTLKEIKWDFDSNGDTDKSERLITYDVNNEGNQTILVEYIFEHIKIKDEIIIVKEKIFFDGIKKEAIIDFIINNDTNYTPVTVKFDASKSTVKDDDIVKFIWDYGDGVSEVRDSIIPGHKYLTPGDYTIKLKVVTKKGKEYEISKQLILKPKPQSLKITTSMKKTITDQLIDFYSSDSEGQIVSYLWKFGDGSNSSQPNPSHSYSKPGRYTVELRADFSNNNVLEDKFEIEIVEDY